MTFNIVFMLFMIGLLLAAILVAILAYPGPVDGSRNAPARHPRRAKPK